MARDQALVSDYRQACPISLAAGQYSEAVRYTEFNLKVSGVSGYDMDRLALLSEDDSNYSKRVPVALGTKTLDSTMYAMKEGELELPRPRGHLLSFTSEWVSTKLRSPVLKSKG